LILDGKLSAGRLEPPHFVKDDRDCRIRLRAEAAFVGLDRHVDGACRCVLLDGQHPRVIIVPRRGIEVKNVLDLAQRLVDDAVEVVCLLVAYGFRLVA
jgi:hypothetical protein